MNKYFTIIILMFLFSVKGYSQKIILKASIDNRVASEQNDTIYYNANRPLAWGDFKGVPDNNSPGGAVTASGFAFNAKMNMSDNVVNLNIKIYTYFSKHSSWKKANIGTDYHLLHEQHHFDITRLYAQKFYDELLKVDLTYSNYNEVLRSTFDRIFKENNEFQTKYDNETQHSINTKEQLKWNDEIGALVKQLPIANNK